MLLFTKLRHLIHPSGFVVPTFCQNTTKCIKIEIWKNNSETQYCITWMHSIKNASIPQQASWLVANRPKVNTKFPKITTLPGSVPEMGECPFQVTKYGFEHKRCANVNEKSKHCFAMNALYMQSLGQKGDTISLYQALWQVLKKKC